MREGFEIFDVQGYLQLQDPTVQMIKCWLFSITFVSPSIGIREKGEWSWNLESNLGFKFQPAIYVILDKPFDSCEPFPSSIKLTK